MEAPVLVVVLATLSVVYLAGALFTFLMMTHFSVRRPPTFVWGYSEWGEALLGSFIAWPYLVFKAMEGAWDD